MIRRDDVLCLPSWHHGKQQKLSWKNHGILLSDFFGNIAILFQSAILFPSAILFQSAMLLNDKTGRDHELYQLFSQYPESLLLEVFSAMKEDGIITRIKKVRSNRILR